MEVHMTTFDIYVDSGANIPNKLCKEREIHVIPYFFTVNGKEQCCYDESVPFEETASAFYDEMRSGAEIQTSLINAETFCSAVRPSLQAGRDVLIFTISSGISGTNKQAQEAKKMLEEEFPERKVFALDSKNASMGEGMLALKTADLRDLGQSAETAAQWVEDNAYRLNSYVTVGDLKYLKKTGRISTTLAIAGTILNIKPIIRADGSANAKLVFFSKERGRKKALAALAEAYRERATDHEKQSVAICHCGCEEDAQYLANLIREIGVSDIIIEYYDLCTGSHVGPGTVALFFFGKDRRLPLPAQEKHSLLNILPKKSESKL